MVSMNTPAYIAITAAVQQLTPSRPVAAIALQHGWDGAPERCYALRIRGRARVVYAPHQRLPGGNSIYLVADDAELALMSLEQSRATLARLEERTPGQPRPQLVYVRANQNLASANRTQGTHWPPIAVQRTRTGTTALYSHVVAVEGGESYLLSCPHRQLACGAKIYLVADERETTVRPLDPIPFKDIRERMRLGMSPDAHSVTIDPSGTITVEAQSERSATATQAALRRKP